MVQLGKDGNHTEEETWVGECWVGFKGAQDAKEDAARIERVVLEFEADRDGVDEEVHLWNDQIECTVRCGRVRLLAYRKDLQIERSEVIKHFGEEVPPCSGVWRQVWECQATSGREVRCFPSQSCKGKRTSRPMFGVSMTSFQQQGLILRSTGRYIV